MKTRVSLKYFVSYCRYYLPLRHNAIAKCVNNKLLINDGQNPKLLQESA